MLQRLGRWMTGGRRGVAEWNDKATPERVEGKPLYRSACMQPAYLTRLTPPSPLAPLAHSPWHITSALCSTRSPSSTSQNAVSVRTYLDQPAPMSSLVTGHTVPRTSLAHTSAMPARSRLSSSSQMQPRLPACQAHIPHYPTHRCYAPAPPSHAVACWRHPASLQPIARPSPLAGRTLGSCAFRAVARSLLKRSGCPCLHTLGPVPRGLHVLALTCAPFSAGQPRRLSQSRPSPHNPWVGRLDPPVKDARPHCWVSILHRRQKKQSAFPSDDMATLLSGWRRPRFEPHLVPLL